MVFPISHRPWPSTRSRKYLPSGRKVEHYGCILYSECVTVCVVLFRPQELACKYFLKLWDLALCVHYSSYWLSDSSDNTYYSCWFHGLGYERAEVRNTLVFIQSLIWTWLPETRSWHVCKGKLWSEKRFLMNWNSFYLKIRPGKIFTMNCQLVAIHS